MPPTRDPPSDQPLFHADPTAVVSAAHYGDALLPWETYAGAPGEGAARVLAHQHAARAARALAANMLASIEGHEALASICRDAGRYVAAMVALHLHFDGGLTLPKLKDTCFASGFLSRGRARGPPDAPAAAVRRDRQRGGWPRSSTLRSDSALPERVVRSSARCARRRLPDRAGGRVCARPAG